MPVFTSCVSSCKSGKPVGKRTEAYLAAALATQVEFSVEITSALRSSCLCAVRQTGIPVHLRKILFHLQGHGQRTPLHRWFVLLPGLPGSVRCASCGVPWPLNPSA